MAKCFASRCIIAAVFIAILVFSVLVNLLIYHSYKYQRFEIEEAYRNMANLTVATDVRKEIQRVSLKSNFINVTIATKDPLRSLTTRPLKKITPPESSNFQNVKVLCWIMTSPYTLNSKARHIKETWGPRCDVTLYMSSKKNPSFPAVGLDVKEGRRFLWSKTKTAFKYIYKNHFKDADWFMKADDDTYVIVENLRYFLRDKNSSEAIYYGHNFNKFTKAGYMSGGAGYVLSKEALKRFATKSNGQPMCDRNYASEDVGMGGCLTAVGVVTGDSRDSLKRARFLPMVISDFVNGRIPGWYQKYKKYDIEKGPGCCSDYLISCHYVRPAMMHFLDYAVYHLRSAGNDDQHVYKIGNKSVII